MPLFTTVSRACEILSDTTIWPYLLKASKPSLASYRMGAALEGLIPAPGTIFDVGANQGQFAGAMAWWYPRAKIVSFEPSPKVFPTLQRNTAKLPHVQLVQSALGDSVGQLDFFESEYSHASSALQTTVAQRELKSETGRTRKVSVPVTTLDLFTEQKKYDGPILLKLDVQGFEKKVLEGAAQFLGRVDFLLFECSYVRLYEGEPLFHEMYNYVFNLGFELVAPVGFLENNRHVLLQADLLWRRRSS